MKESERKLIGRSDELRRIKACLHAKRNVLLEGPVGVGKTRLALSAISSFKSKMFRIDGDARFSEQKLTGWFEPTLVLKKGYSAGSFVPGPLVEAMKSGGVLFINELNRLPEGVQNVLLPAIDERRIIVPKLGEIGAKDGFVIIATQNPKEFVATTHLSEAIMDRFELIMIDYQTEAEEIEIVMAGLRDAPGRKDGRIASTAVAVTRLTRCHPLIRRGASVRAAQSIADLASALIKDGRTFDIAIREAAAMALPTRIETHTSDEDGEAVNVKNLVGLLIDEVMMRSSKRGAADQKKKN